MRENRTNGSEGGEDGVLLYPYQIQMGADCLCRSRALATKAVQFRLVRLRHTKNRPDPPALHFTITRAFGATPNISGAYMASTRDGGSENSLTLFSRKVYSILTTPLGKNW